MFFVVPGNRQALLGMPDTMMLNLINLNIDSIQTSRRVQINKKQETHTSVVACTNTSTTRSEGAKDNSVRGDNKQDTNGHSHPGNKHIN